jgi:hypothetical protein
VPKHDKASESTDKLNSNEESRVEELLERISEGMQPTERHESMETLKGLLQTSTQAVESFSLMGVPIMCAVIRDDQDNLELVQVLPILLTPHHGC